MENNSLELYRVDIDCLVLRFNSSFESVFFDSFFRGLSINSNQKFGVNFMGELFNVVYLEQRGYSIIMFQSGDDMILELKRVDDIGLSLDVSYMVTFYAAYFYRDDLSWLLPKFVSRYSDYISVSRCDICVDINIPVQKLYDTLTTKFTTETKFYNKVLETFYLGKKTNNKRHFIRVYDKIRDTVAKGKFTLFSSYVVKDCVTRIEAQINTEACKSYGIDVNFLKKYIKEGSIKSLFPIIRYLMLNPSGTYFPELLTTFASEERINKYLSRTSKPTQTEILDKIKYAKIMLGYSKRLLDQGFDVISYLNYRLDFRLQTINNTRIYINYAIFYTINFRKTNYSSDKVASQVSFCIRSRLRCRIPWLVFPVPLVQTP